MMDKPAIDDLIGQLETIRRERKQLLGAGSVLVVAGLVLVAAGAGFVRKSRVIEAEQFLLKDHDGRVRARLATASDGSPAFALVDGLGRDVVTLHGSGNESAVLSLMNRGRTRVALAATSDGAVTLNFFDGKNRSATGMYLWSDGSAGIGLRNGGSEVKIAAKPDGEAGLSVTGPDGRERTQVGSLRPDPAPKPTASLPGGAQGPSLAPMLGSGAQGFSRLGVSNPRIGISQAVPAAQ
jgi:hypothetical protein